MSLHQKIAFAPAAVIGSPPSRGVPTDARQLRSQVWIARLAGMWGFAGAVLVQTAAFCLVAGMALEIDSVVMPGPAASTIGLALGALAMAGSKSFTAQRRHAG